MSNIRAIPAALVPLLAVSACEPASVSEARDQLGRGGERTVDYLLPVTFDSLTIDTFLPEDRVTISSSGLAGVLLSPESTSVAVGDRLRFEGVTFDAFVFSYDQMLTTNEVGQIAPTTVTFATPDGSAVTEGTVDTGWVVRTVTNTTDCDATAGLTLTDATGATLASFPDEAVPARGDLTDSVSTAGDTFEESITATPSVDFLPCMSSTDSVTTEVTFRPMQLASVTLENVNETFTETYEPLQSEDRLQAVDTVVVEEGTFRATVQNRLPTDVQVDLTLEGTSRGGAPLTTSTVVPAAPGDGSLTGRVVEFDLAGVTLLPAVVRALVDGVAAASAVTVTPLTTTDAILVDGDGEFQASALAGPLDPTRTPELTVAVENAEEFDRASVDFGDFEDAVRDATLNEAEAVVRLINTSQVPVVLTGFTLGVVELDAAGDIPRDGNGDPLYETDDAGQPILVPVTEVGDTVFRLARQETDTTVLGIALLADRLVTLVLNDRRGAVVAAGTAVLGDGEASRVTLDDAVDVRLDMTVGLDVTIPDTGVTISRNTVFDGVGLDEADARQIEERVVAASVFSRVVNGSAFAVEVDIGFVGGDLGDADVFGQADAIVLAPVAVGAPVVDAQGRVVEPTSDSVTIALTGSEIGVLLRGVVTATARVRILPSDGTAGRGAIRIDDPVVVNARAELRVRSGSP